MEIVSVLILALLLFGPIVWLFTKGRHARAPDQKDKHNSGTFGYLIRKVLTTGRR